MFPADDKNRDVNDVAMHLEDDLPELKEVKTELTAGMETEGRQSDDKSNQDACADSLSSDKGLLQPKAPKRSGFVMTALAGAIALAAGLYLILHPALYLSGVNYSTDYNGYQIQAELAAAQGKFERSEEAWTRAIDTAIGQKITSQKLGTLYVRAGDSVALHPDPAPDNSTDTAAYLLTHQTYHKAARLASQYYANAASLFALINDQERELEALTRLMCSADDGDRSKNKIILLRVVALSQGPGGIKEPLLPAYNQLAQLEMDNGHTELARRYLEQALAVEQHLLHYGIASEQIMQSYPLCGYFVPRIASLDLLLSIYKRQHDYKNAAKLLNYAVTQRFPEHQLSWKELEMLIDLIYADQKLGNVAEAEIYKKEVAGARKHGPQFQNWWISNADPNYVPSW